MSLEVYGIREESLHILHQDGGQKRVLDMGDRMEYPLRLQVEEALGKQEEHRLANMLLERLYNLILQQFPQHIFLLLQDITFQREVERGNLIAFVRLFPISKKEEAKVERFLGEPLRFGLGAL